MKKEITNQNSSTFQYFFTIPILIDCILTSEFAILVSGVLNSYIVTRSNTTEVGKLTGLIFNMLFDRK